MEKLKLCNRETPSIIKILLEAMKRSKKPRRGVVVFLLILIVFTSALVYGIANAKTVRVVYLDMPMANLDYRLNGVKILFLSDLKISSEAEADRAVSLIKRLTQLEPDAILIGGDICSVGLIDEIGLKFGFRAKDQVDIKRLSALDRFLSGINETAVRYPVLAVTGDTDPNLSKTYKARTGVRFLENEGVNLSINGAKLPVYGASYGTKQLKLPSGDGAIIIFFHDPTLYTAAALRSSERSSNSHNSLLLSGHLLDGQVKIGSLFMYENALNKIFTLKTDENGIFSDGSGIRMLPGSGIGTEGLPIRLFTEPKAYLITLRKE